MVVYNEGPAGTTRLGATTHCTTPAVRLAHPAGSGASHPRSEGAIDAIERQRRLTRLNGLLLTGDGAAALRFWSESGLARDPEAVAQLGKRIDALAERLRTPAPPTFGTRPSPPAFPTPDHPTRPGSAPRPGALAERLRSALAGGDAETVLRLWTGARDAPLPLGLAARVQAYLDHVVGGAIRRAIQRGDDEAVVAAVRAAERAGLTISTEARHAARRAEQRTATRRALDAALASGDRPALAALALSGRLDELARLPGATTRAVERALAWPLLERAFAADDDAAILAAYEPGLFDDDPALPPPYRLRVELAQRRTAWLFKVRTALRRRDVATLRAAMADPPPGAEARLSRVERARIDRLALRDAAAERLLRALQEGPDEAVVAALDAVEAAGAPLPAALDWAAVRGVVDRVTLAAAIREATAADPPDYVRLARLLPAARAALAEGRPGHDRIDFARLEADLLRAAHLARLREAIEAGDDAAIAHAAVPDPYRALERLSAPDRDRVEAALRTTRAARQRGS